MCISLKCYTIILIGIITYITSITCKDVSNCQVKCKISKVHGLKTSDCYKLDLKEFPKCLPSDIEVAELSYNRIRKVKKSDLNLYSNLKYLYLTENIIINIDDETFKDLNQLKALDLSMNAITKIPPSVFKLPNLMSLYLGNNPNLNITESIEEAKPILSPLTQLDISYITDNDNFENGPMVFPNFGEMPFLVMLNISGDKFTNLSTRHFAGLCKLETLDNANSTIEYKNSCECLKINRWLNSRNVKFNQFRCPNVIEECPDNLNINEDDIKVYDRCSQQFEQYKQATLIKKIGIGIGISIGIILIIVGIFFYQKFQRNKQKQITTTKASVVVNDDFHLLKKQTRI